MRTVGGYIGFVGFVLVGASIALTPTLTPTFAQTAPGAAAAITEPAPTAAEVASDFAKAVVRHDIGTAATYVTETSRADFLALIDLGDRLQRARGDLQTAVDQKFRPEPARSLGVDAPPNVVLTAEVAAQRQISPTLVELDMRLYTTKQNSPTQIVTWRAVQTGGTWKIELPQCASPDIAAPLKQRFQTVLDAHLTVAAAINKGEFASATDARAALLAAQRGAIPTQPR
ncbi:MAG: hypothetical protein QOD40_58 [Alphaproteobacteria bacterium]|nr:hypothetical protein [Alphaproteobacteria bacterium]